MTESSYKIPRWPKNERPRERLLQDGPQHLTEAELLGILLGKGTRNKTAIDLARELLDRYESLPKLFSRSPSELTTVKGIGSAKAAILSAAFELVRRIQSRKDVDRPLFKRSSDVAGHYLPLMRDLRKEVFKVLLLNRANRFIKEVFISEGTLDASIVHPRDVFREALLEPAAGSKSASLKTSLGWTMLASSVPSEMKTSLMNRLARLRRRTLKTSFLKSLIRGR